MTLIGIKNEKNEIFLDGGRFSFIVKENDELKIIDLIEVNDIDNLTRYTSWCQFRGPYPADHMSFHPTKKEMEIKHFHSPCFVGWETIENVMAFSIVTTGEGEDECERAFVEPFIFDWDRTVEI